MVQLGQVRAFSLLVIENVDGAKSDHDALRFAFGLLLPFVLPAAKAGDRSKNLNSLLPALDEPAKLLPLAVSAHAGSGGSLTGDLQDVPERIVVEPRYGAEIGGEYVAVSGLKLLDEVIHGLPDEGLRGVVLLAGAFLIGLVAAVVPLRRIFAVRRGVAAAGAAIAGGNAGDGSW